MPPLPEEGKPISGSGKMPERPSRRVSLIRRQMLFLAMFILGLPVILVMLGPPLVGSWILWRQFALFQEDGQWHRFSLFELATRTADQKLAVSLGWPSLAVCNEFQETAGSGSSAGVLPSEQFHPNCSELGPWQSWLLRPASLLAWHRRVAGVFRFVPVSSALFLLGLISSYLLRLFGTDWRFLGGPPEPPPLGGSARSPGNHNKTAHPSRPPPRTPRIEAKRSGT